MNNFGTFLLMQSPSARSSQEIYARGVEMAQAAETLGFRNVWLAEHHFSTYGYLSRPVQLATYIAAKTTRLRVGTAVIVVPLHHPLVIAEEIATLDLLAGGRVDIGLGRGYQHYEFERFGLELDERPRAVGGVGRHHPEGVRGRAVHLRRQALQDSRDDDLPAAAAEAASADLDHGAEPRFGRGGGAARLQRAHRRLRRPDRAHWRSSGRLFDRVVAEVKPRAAARGRRAARGLRDGERRPTRAPPPRRRAGTCA